VEIRNRSSPARRKTGTAHSCSKLGRPSSEWRPIQPPGNPWQKSIPGGRATANPSPTTARIAALAGNDFGHGLLAALSELLESGFHKIGLSKPLPLRGNVGLCNGVLTRSFWSVSDPSVSPVGNYDDCRTTQIQKTKTGAQSTGDRKVAIFDSTLIQKSKDNGHKQYGQLRCL